MQKYLNKNVEKLLAEELWNRGVHLDGFLDPSYHDCKPFTKSKKEAEPVQQLIEEEREEP